MITKTAHHTGRGSASLAQLRRMLIAALALLGLLSAVPAFATNVLQDVSSAPLPGGKVQLTLKFAQPVNAPRAFSTDNPPRIALDFADTHNAMTQRRVAVGSGSTTAVTAVEAGNRTRVVVDLTEPSAYVTSVQGNEVLVTINDGMNMASVPADTAMAQVPAPPPTQMAIATAATDPSKAVPMATGIVISNVDFRRGSHGQGRLVLNFSGPGASSSMHEEGDRTIIEVNGARLPASQARRLDVVDYATPVQSVNTHATPGGARIDVISQGVVQTSAYQSGNEYVVEFAPPKKDNSSTLLGAPKPVVYKGSRVTFNFQDIPVRSVLQLLADVSGTNIVASDSVQGNVTLRLVNVPWDQALDVVLRAKSLDKRKNGNVVWVAPQTELATYEQNVADARLKQLDNAALVSDYIPISYGKAKDIATLLTQGSLTNQQGGGGATSGQQRGFLSNRGSVSFDERTNTLLINDTPEKVQEIRQLIAVLDKPVEQVLIEARIVIATDNFTRELGAKLGLGMFHVNPSGQGLITGASSDDINTTAKSISANRNAQLQNAFNAVNAPAGTTPTPTFPPAITIPGGLNVNLPSTLQGTSSFALGILGSDYLVDLELSAAQQEGRSETISAPKVITANQQEAVIQQGQEIGFLTFQNSGGAGGGQGTATVQFKDAVLELRVTPTITADNRVFMQLQVKKDAINALVPNPGGGFVPQLDKREIDTSVLVDNGQTVVLGGVYEFQKSTDLTKVPFLGDIPVLGALFRDKKNINNKAELLIFITPRILNRDKVME